MRGGRAGAASTRRETVGRGNSPGGKPAASRNTTAGAQQPNGQDRVEQDGNVAAGTGQSRPGQRADGRVDGKAGALGTGLGGGCRPRDPTSPQHGSRRAVERWPGPDTSTTRHPPDRLAGARKRNSGMEPGRLQPPASPGPPAVRGRAGRGPARRRASAPGHDNGPAPARGRAHLWPDRARPVRCLGLKFSSKGSEAPRRSRRLYPSS